jgi:uncharacterized protein with PIN domain
MPPPRPLRFVTDRSLGGLARWLRTLGFDTIYAPDLSDRAAVAAAKTGRILVTRTLALRRRADIPRMVFVTADRTLDQLPQAIRGAEIRPEELALFSRCLSWNLPLAAVSKTQVFGQVPEYVWHTRETFSICPGCGRVFWSGSHRERVRRRIDALWRASRTPADTSARR